MLVGNATAYCFAIGRGGANETETFCDSEQSVWFYIYVWMCLYMSKITRVRFDLNEPESNLCNFQIIIYLLFLSVAIWTFLCSTPKSSTKYINHHQYLISVSNNAWSLFHFLVYLAQGKYCNHPIISHRVFDWSLRIGPP